MPAYAQTPTADDFNPGAGGGYYPLVSSLAVQADGKILVGGEFTTLGGQPRHHLARLNADGTLDPTFNPGAGNPQTVDRVYSLAVQADGKILVGGRFRTLGGQSRLNLGRLNADGTLDPTFNPGASWTVYSLAVQADGKILVGGNFTRLGGQPRACLGRLNADGTLDPTFNPRAEGGNSPFVDSLVVQADGKILVGGRFRTLGGQPRDSLGRLNADGTLDTSFYPKVGIFAPHVHCLVVQADGKILVGGEFTMLGGQPRNHLGRLNANGTLDPTFNPGAGDGNYLYVYSLAVQADGKILVGGVFITLSGQLRYGLGRLNADGTLDPTFNPEMGGVYAPHVHSLAVQADGKILVGGWFTMLGGQPRDNLGRLNNTAPATQSLRYDGVTITWLRGNTSPKVWRTTFDYSTDGVFWTSLGDGIRIPGGWQLTGVALPADGTLRARGFATGGYGNASSGFVESLATKTNGLPAGHTSGMPRRVVVVGEQPQLEAFLSPNGEPALILYAPPGSTNTLEFATQLEGAPVWTAGQTVVLPTNALFEVVQPIGITNNAVFIRAVRE